MGTGDGDGGRATRMTRIWEDWEDPRGGNVGKFEIRDSKFETNSNEGRLEWGGTGGGQHG